MLTHSVRLALVVLLTAPLLACGGDDDPPGPGELMGARLEFVSPQTQSLRYGATADLRVRYVLGDGSPVSGAILGYEIDGFAADSSLAARQASTGDTGEANVPVTVGSADLSFRVIVTPPVGDPITFTIGVADFDAGSINVEMGYTGTKRLDNFEAVLFDGATCASLDPTALPTALIAAAPVDNITARPGFSPVAAGPGYAVAVVAEIAGRLEGFGCTDGILVEVAKETLVHVDIFDQDRPVLIEGPYELDNILDFGGLLPPSIDTAVNVLDELTDDNNIDGNAATMDYGQDPGAFLVDFAMRQTCHWECMSGEDFDTCSEINHRTGDISAIYLESFRTWPGAEAAFFGGCGTWEDAVIPAQNLVNAQITSRIPSSVIMFATMAGDLARAIDQAHIISYLTLDPAVEGQADFTHELQRMVVVLHDLSGVEHVVEVDLRDAGFSAMPTADAVAMIIGSRLELAEHSFTLEWGRLLTHIYRRGLLPVLGYTSSAAMLDDWVDCAAVGASLAASVGVLSEAQYTDACSAGLAAAGALLDDVGIGALVDDVGTLRLQGTAVAADLSADGLAQSLDDGRWSGAWGEGADTGDIEGTFTGIRR